MNLASLRWCLSLWRPHRWWVLPMVVLTVLNGLAVAGIPLAIRYVFDTLTHDFNDATLKRSVACLIAVGIGRFLVYTTLQNCRAYLNCRLDWSIRSRLFRHLLTLGPSFFNRYPVGDLVTRLTDDISDDMKLSWFLCSGLFRTLEALSIVTVVTVAMARLNGMLTVCCLVPLPFILLVFVVVSARLHEGFSAKQAGISSVNAEIESTFSGIQVVKSYAAEAVREAAFHQVATQRRQAELRAVRWQALMDGVFSSAWQISAAVVLLVGGRLVVQQVITLGDFVAFNGLALSLTFPMFDFGQFLTGGRQAMVFIQRLHSLELDRPDITSGALSLSTPHESAYVGQAVTYRYAPQAPTAVCVVDLRVRTGGFVAIVGRVGYGKSTLMRLLLRLMDPDEGELFKHGISLSHLTLDAARAGVGYVPQDAVLLSESIHDNVRFGRSWISEADVQWAIELAQLAPDMQSFADRGATAVGPRGLQLSGGQKQRVALARALAGRPSLLLLDDCTASLDAQTETRLWEALRRELPDVTVVVVTHRTQELEKADDILVLGPGGVVVESGRHLDLLARGGEYRRLYQRYQDSEVA